MQGTGEGMEVSDNRRCFICGPNNKIGLKIRPEYDWTAGRAWLKLVIPDDFQGWEGVVHGGMVAALFDEVSVYAAMAESRQVVTAELHTFYLKPVPTGENVMIEASVRNRSGRSIMVDATLVFNGKLLARSEARIVVLKQPAPA